MIFNHLHCHTQFSLLDGAADITKMLTKAKNDGMRGCAITDHGNMFGVFKFVAEAAKIGIKPIVGCEFYLVNDRHRRQFTKGEKDQRFHQLLLAKNEEGYRNLIKMCSLGFIEGMYGKYPRIDKELIVKYHTGLIATTCCLGAEVPQTILKKGEEEGEKAFKWWLDLFGEDYYVEIQRHEIPDQIKVNEVLLKFAAKYNVKIIASNDSHYVEREDSNAHDILLCINTGEKQSTPTMKDFADDDEGTKGKRFAFYNDEFYFKTTAEMTKLFQDLPQAIDNTNEIVDKCDQLKLKRDILLPNFQVPAAFLSQDDYLRHITMEGARKRYKEITPETQERIDFELNTIKTMGFAGYFLIVQDYINAGRELGVFVGPGRGCLVGDTRVVMKDGTSKRLDSVKVGDEVITIDGTARKVLQTFEYEINEDLVNVKAYYGELEGITLTKDHKVWVEKTQNHASKKGKYKVANSYHRPKGELGWKPAGELEENDWVMVSKPIVEEIQDTDFDLLALMQSKGYEVKEEDDYLILGDEKVKRFIPLNEDNYIFLGILTGSDWFLDEKRKEAKLVINTKNPAKVDFLRKKLKDMGWDYFENSLSQYISQAYRRQSSIELYVRSEIFVEFLLHLFPDYKHTSDTKHIPELVIRAKVANLRYFLRGMIGVLGCDKRTAHAINTISRAFADQIRFVYWRLDIPVNIVARPVKRSFEKHKVNCTITVPREERWESGIAGLFSHYHAWKGGFLVPVKDVTTVKNIKKVYDIEIEENHNYLTTTCVVHNSAAGSAVAYCIGITNIDPIKYDLLFERFLNPDRKSMPDIDTDFDDEGRQKVIDYVVDKYGRNQVAQIITYGSMAAKMSIKDVARVLDLPLATANSMAKLIPEKPGIKLNRVMTAPLDGEKSLSEKEGLDADALENVKKLRALFANNGSEEWKVLTSALKLEGSVRNTGIHAAGIIIAPCDLTDLIPVSIAKDSDLYVTQFEGKVIEDAGVIKMDFLGLKNLTIIRDALKMIKQNHGIEIVIDDVPLDDKKTFELYQKGKTNGTFQFESTGMQKYLKELRPDKFEDLIAMNALYRPGPLAYIPTYIARKHGLEPVEYDVPEMEEYLKDTHGINVYQEQVMLLSQKLAGFSKGDADVLRKAMGKKDRQTLDKMKGKFLEGCGKKNLDLAKCEKVWTDWEAFASYAFNKSHSTCYAFVAFQTAYLKAHYTAEYMASVLTHSSNKTEKVTFFIDECKSLGIDVLPPDINESHVLFSVNKKGQIRFGLGALKGVGAEVMEKIIQERTDNGAFKSLFDMLKRLPARSLNKRILEALINAGALDCYGIERYRYFLKVNLKDETNLMERALSWGGKMQQDKNSSQNSLFGGGGEEDFVEAEPIIPTAPDQAWTRLEELNFEKQVTGFYLSGHPLDRFRWQLESFPKYILRVEELQDKEDASDEETGGAPKQQKPKPINQTVRLAGIVTEVNEKFTKNGKKFITFSLEDYTGSMEFALFKEDMVNKFRPFLEKDAMLLVTGVYQARYNDPNAFELQIKEIVELREELFEGLIKNVSIFFNNLELTDRVITELDALFLQKKTGKFPIRFFVKDTGVSNSWVGLESEYRATPDKTLIESLRKLGVEYALA